MKKCPGKNGCYCKGFCIECDCCACQCNSINHGKDQNMNNNFIGLAPNQLESLNAIEKFKFWLEGFINGCKGNINQDDMNKIMEKVKELLSVASADNARFTQHLIYQNKDVTLPEYHKEQNRQILNNI